MSNRNPSRAGKSEKEKQYLTRVLKVIPSSDTAQIETPFEPSNVVSDDKEPKKSIKNRPQSRWRKLTTHVKRNSAAYIVCLIMLIVGLVVTPFISLNREVGEVKIEVKNMKEMVANETNTTKQQFSKLFEQVSDLLNKITSIKMYLLNKLGAKF